MLKMADKIFDRFRGWKYIETAYNPKKCYRKDSPMSRQVKSFDKLEIVYEWCYDNLEGEWDHVTREVKKGRLCRATNKHLFAFKRISDMIAFKLQWAGSHEET